jgi:hypothetical protein
MTLNEKKQNFPFSLLGTIPMTFSWLPKKAKMEKNKNSKREKIIIRRRYLLKAS